MLFVLFPFFCEAFRVPGHIQFSVRNIDFLPFPNARPLTLPKTVNVNRLIGVSSKFSDPIVQEAILQCADMCERHVTFNEICHSFIFIPGRKDMKCQGFLNKIEPRMIHSDSDVNQQPRGWIFKFVTYFAYLFIPSRKLKDPPNWFPDFYSNLNLYSHTISRQVFKLTNKMSISSLKNYLEKEKRVYVNSLVSSLKVKNSCYNEATLDPASEIAVYAYIKKFIHHSNLSDFSSSNPKSMDCLKLEVSSTALERKRIVQPLQIASEGTDPYWLVLVVDPGFNFLAIIDVSSKAQYPIFSWNRLKSIFQLDRHPYGSQPKSFEFYLNHTVISPFLDTMFHAAKVTSFSVSLYTGFIAPSVAERPAYALLVAQAIASTFSWVVQYSSIPQVSWLKRLPCVPTMSQWKEKIKWFLSSGVIDTPSNTGLAKNLGQSKFSDIDILRAESPD